MSLQAYMSFVIVCQTRRANNEAWSYCAPAPSANLNEAWRLFTEWQICFCRRQLWLLSEQLYGTEISGGRDCNPFPPFLWTRLAECCRYVFRETCIGTVLTPADTRARALIFCHHSSHRPIDQYFEPSGVRGTRYPFLYPHVLYIICKSACVISKYRLLNELCPMAWLIYTCVVCSCPSLPDTVRMEYLSSLCVGSLLSGRFIANALVLFNFFNICHSTSLFHSALCSFVPVGIHGSCSCFYTKANSEWIGEYLIGSAGGFRENTHNIKMELRDRMGWYGLDLFASG
jgi:hypothetical protein